MSSFDERVHSLWFGMQAVLAELFFHLQIGESILHAASFLAIDLFLMGVIEVHHCEETLKSGQFFVQDSA